MTDVPGDTWPSTNHGGSEAGGRHLNSAVVPPVEPIGEVLVADLSCRGMSALAAVDGFRQS